MGLLQGLMGLAVGGSVGLLVAAAILPTADTAINGATLNDTGADALWQLLPLFMVVAIVAVMISFAVKDYF